MTLNHCRIHNRATPSACASIVGQSEIGASVPLAPHHNPTQPPPAAAAPRPQSSTSPPALRRRDSATPQRPAQPAASHLPPAPPAHRPFGMPRQRCRLSLHRFVPTSPPTIISKPARPRPRRSPPAGAWTPSPPEACGTGVDFVNSCASGLASHFARCAGAVLPFVWPSELFRYPTHLRGRGADSTASLHPSPPHPPAPLLGVTSQLRTDCCPLVRSLSPSSDSEKKDRTTHPASARCRRPTEHHSGHRYEGDFFLPPHPTRTTPAPSALTPHPFYNPNRRARHQLLSTQDVDCSLPRLPLDYDPSTCATSSPTLPTLRTPTAPSEKIHTLSRLNFFLDPSRSRQHWLTLSPRTVTVPLIRHAPDVHRTVRCHTTETPPFHSQTLIPKPYLRPIIMKGAPRQTKRHDYRQRHPQKPHQPLIHRHHYLSCSPTVSTPARHHADPYAQCTRESASRTRENQSARRADTPGSPPAPTTLPLLLALPSPNIVTDRTAPVHPAPSLAPAKTRCHSLRDQKGIPFYSAFPRSITVESEGKF
jgi:hypothetical protein